MCAETPGPGLHTSFKQIQQEMTSQITNHYNSVLQFVYLDTFESSISVAVFEIPCRQERADITRLETMVSGSAMD